MTPYVYFTGMVPEADLPSLYRGAQALIFASLYEGFGLPLLEALACGVPTVTSTAGALPEVAANAALLVDPTSVEQIAAAMQRIINDTTLRQHLRQDGFARAAKFSWQTTANKIQKILYS
jgi:glycosyltransferase involved in cell wall biosynthesis